MPNTNPSNNDLLKEGAVFSDTIDWDDSKETPTVA
jgi:hypothetical protein